MENEIKVNEYVRTNHGEIGKVFAIEENPKRYFYDDCGNNVLERDIDKHSFNLIDIIECGDYVNNYCIEEKKGKYLITDHIDFENSSFWNIKYYEIRENDIEGIVTWQQMKAIAYKVKPEEN